MGKVLKIILAFVVSWMFFYPLNFTFLPGSINSKMLVAVLGLVVLWKDLVDKRSGFVARKSIVTMFVIAILFSLMCFGTTVINNTQTKDYLTYVVSMSVWFSAAYASCGMIRYAHNKVSVILIGRYVIAMCALQACLSFSFEIFPSVHSLLSRFFVILPTDGIRLIGLGTSADTGGVRFAISLVFITYFLCLPQPAIKEKIVLSVSFLLIIIFGNMMARTTTVGAILSIIYMVFYSCFFSKRESSTVHPIKVLVLTSICFIPLLVILNHIFPQTENFYEFAFEGFYNLIENGEWATSSTNILLDMWKIWPDNLKTWLIGDGLLLNPEDPSLYYMGTDVGYARFVFFCGLLGFLPFISLFIYIYTVLKDRLPHHSKLLLLILIMVFLVWVKVTTDIFFVFALLLCVRPEDEQGLIDENTI